MKVCGSKVGSCICRVRHDEKQGTNATKFSKLSVRSAKVRSDLIVGQEFRINNIPEDIQSCNAHLRPKSELIFQRTFYAFLYEEIHRDPR